MNDDYDEDQEYILATEAWYNGDHEEEAIVQIYNEARE